MIAFIQLFCVSFILCFSSAECHELHFCPNEISEIQTKTLFTEEITFSDTTTKYENLQKAQFDIVLNEKGQYFEPIENFPFQFTLTLQDLQWSEQEELSMEKCEVHSVLHRPLKFLMAERNAPLVLEKNQQKLFGNYQFFSSNVFKGSIEDELHTLFSLAEMPLKIGESYSFPKKVGYSDILITYTVTEITSEHVQASIHGKLDRKRVVFNYENKELEGVVNGLLLGNITWERKNALFYSCHYEGIFDVNLKNDGLLSSLKLSIKKDSLAKRKERSS